EVRARDIAHGVNHGQDHQAKGERDPHVSHRATAHVINHDRARAREYQGERAQEFGKAFLSCVHRIGNRRWPIESVKARCVTFLKRQPGANGRPARSRHKAARIETAPTRWIQLFPRATCRPIFWRLHTCPCFDYPCLWWKSRTRRDSAGRLSARGGNKIGREFSQGCGWYYGLFKTPPRFLQTVFNRASYRVASGGARLRPVRRPV